MILIFSQHFNIFIMEKSHLQNNFFKTSSSVGNRFWTLHNRVDTLRVILRTLYDNTTHFHYGQPNCLLQK